MKKNNFLKLSYYFILLVLTLVYIIYRIFFTIPTKLGTLSLILALIVLFVEIWESFDFFVYYLNILSVKKYIPKTPNIDLNQNNCPDIDIFIATLNESPDLLRNTINSCLNLKYPDKNKLHIYLCDDGNRNYIKQLADELNINYLTRTTNKDSKSGNYNSALKKTTSPYIATFDADMAPLPDFLLTTLPYFLSSTQKIGFVQTPQSFTNPDIFQYRFKLEDNIPFEQDYFYHELQIAKNTTNSAVCCGTNTLFSREALNKTNGFATGTISEDIATGMLIESKGYKCIAINDIKAYGTSTNDLDSFIKQRSRWARGCVQMLKKYKILTCKGLSLRQKLEYLSCVSYWFFGVKRMIYLITPLLFSIFGIIIVDCNLKTFIAIWLPQYLLKRYVLDKAEHNKRSATWNKIYETILAPILSKEVTKEFLGFTKTNFEVTPKYITKNKKMSKQNKKLLFKHLGLLSLNILGLILCLLKLYNNNLTIYILSLVWTISNIFYLTIATIFDTRIKNYNYNNFVPNKITQYSAKSIFLIFFNRRKKHA